MRRWRTGPWHHSALRYGLAAGAVGTGFLLRLGLTSLVGEGLPTYITFYPAVMVAGLLGGFGPGLVATALTGLVTACWILPPQGFVVADVRDLVGLGLFSFMGLSMSAVAELYRRTRVKAAAYDQEMALREIRREKDLLASLLEHASQPFAVGYPDGRMGRCNAAYEELTGYSAAELRALDWSAVLTPPEWREMEMHHLGDLQRTGQPVRYEKEYLRKDGTRVPVELLVHLVRDAAGQLWDYGAHAAGSPWPFNVRHLREGTNTVTVFAVMPSGQVASNSVRLTMTLGPAPAVRPRPVPAEIWWGGSCHDNLYDTNGNIRGTYSRMAQLANTNLSWDFVKRWQDGLFLHGYVWVNNIARMTNWSAAAQSISAQLAPWRGKFWLENAWRPATNINFGHSSAGGELSDEADLRGTGMVLSEMDQDFNPQAQDFALWHPDWPVLDHVAATTGDLSLAGTNYPYASGEWRDFVTDFHASAPHVQQGWVYSPVWITGRTGPRWARTTTSSTRSATAATTSSMSPASR